MTSLALLPFQGAGLSGLSDLRLFSHPFGRFTRSGLFFHLKAPKESCNSPSRLSLLPVTPRLQRKVGQT
jgi:hypothetical protein